MKRRVGIIGTGWVGSSVAISTLYSGVADEVLLCDARTQIAEGEAMDLGHGGSFYPSAIVRTASIADMIDADAVVVSAGRGGRPEESRLDLLRDNAAIVRGIAGQLRGARGTIVVVTNPVDVLTRLMAGVTGLPPSRVIGTGTMLDTARLRQMLAQRIQIDSRSIHAQVVGEHGDSEVVLWSGARVAGRPLRNWPGWEPSSERTIADELRTSAYEIIRRKGATNHAIGLVTASLLGAILRGERRVLTVSRVQDILGLEGVALSLPAVVGAGGAETVLEPEMTVGERQALEHSADVLRRAADDLTA